MTGFECSQKVVDDLATFVWKMRADMNRDGKSATMGEVLEAAFVKFDAALMKLLVDPLADKRPAVAGACVVFAVVDGLDLWVARGFRPLPRLQTA